MSIFRTNILENILQFPCLAIDSYEVPPTNLHSNKKDLNLNMRIYEKQAPKSNNSPFKTSRSGLDSPFDMNQGCFKDEIKRLQDLIRKSQIEKAELDLKLTQAQNRETGKDSPSVTRILYQENRELRKQIRELRDMIGNFRVERKTSDSGMKSVSPIPTSRPENQFKDKFYEIKGILFREKVKTAKKISTLILARIVSEFILPVKRMTFNRVKDFRNLKNLDFSTVQKELNRKQKSFKPYETQTKQLKKILMIQSKQLKKKFLFYWKSVNFSQKLNIFSSLLKKVFNYHVKNRIFCTGFNALKIFSFSKQLSVKNQEILEKSELLRKFQMKKEENKRLQKQLITSIFIKNLRRILAGKCRELMKHLQIFSRVSTKKIDIFRKVMKNKSKVELLNKFNYWKHKILNMNINDLCKLHEEQRIEKDYLIEQFDLIRVENNENLEKKFKFSAFNKLKTIKNLSLKILKQKSFFKWFIKTEEIRKRLEAVKSICYRIVSASFRQKYQIFSVIFKENQTKNPKKLQNPKIHEKIAFNKFSLLKKTFQVFSINRIKSKLKRKFLEKFLKNLKTKKKFLYFREFYRNCRFRLLKNMKEESLLMTKTNQFLEETLFAANSMIQESGQVLGAFEKRMLNKSLKLALGFSEKNLFILKREFFNKWKKARNFRNKFLCKAQECFFNSVLVKAKTFYKWKSVQSKASTKFKEIGSLIQKKSIILNPEEKKRVPKNPSKLIKIMKTKAKELIEKCFQSWKIFKGFSEFVEMIETEKYDNFCYKVSAVLTKCKISKCRAGFSHWIRKIKRLKQSDAAFNRFFKLLKARVSKSFQSVVKSLRKNEQLNKEKKIKQALKILKEKTLKIFSFCFKSLKKQKKHAKCERFESFFNLINKKIREILKSGFFSLSCFGMIQKKTICLKNLEKVSKFKRIVKLFTSFNQLKMNVMMLKTSSLKSDCDELLKLADYSEHLIDQQELKLQKTLKKRKSYKSTVDFLITQKKILSIKFKLFSSWKSRIHLLKAKLSHLLKIFKNNILKKSLNIFKKVKNTEKFSDTLLVDSPTLLRIPQDSIEFEISDPSILPFNYKKLTPSIDQKDLPLKSLKFLMLQKRKNDKLSAWFSWCRIVAPRRERLSLRNSFSAVHQKTLRTTLIKKLINSLLSTRRLKNFAFLAWKKNSLKNPQKSSKTEKKSGYQEIIKKLLQENMNMAYKLSSAQVASKNIMKVTNDLCLSNKENVPSLKAPK